MTDFEGKELNVKDEVLFIMAYNSSARFEKGTIVKLTEHSALISYGSVGYTVRKSSSYIYKL